MAVRSQGSCGSLINHVQVSMYIQCTMQAIHMHMRHWTTGCLHRQQSQLHVSACKLKVVSKHRRGREWLLVMIVVYHLGHTCTCTCTKSPSDSSKGHHHSNTAQYHTPTTMNRATHVHIQMHISCTLCTCTCVHVVHVDQYMIGYATRMGRGTYIVCKHVHSMYSTL